MIDSQDKTERRLGFGVLVCVLVAVLVIWALSGWAVNYAEGNNRGTFGDMFGAVNALFSGLAFACLIYAVFMQREELSLQRKELQLAREEAAATRKEIEGQKEQAIIQNNIWSVQGTENKLFQLLGFHDQILNGIIVKAPNGIPRQGRQAFDEIFEQMVSNHSNVSSNQAVPRENVLPTVLSNLEPMFEQNLGHYLRSLRGVIHFIDKNPQLDQLRYSSMVADNLSGREIAVLQYACMSNTKYSDLKKLIEKYGLLRNSTRFERLERGMLEENYATSAFTVPGYVAS